MKNKMAVLLVVALSFQLQLPAQSIANCGFTTEQINAVKKSGSGISGAGTTVVGNGYGGWRSGLDGVQYRGTHDTPLWSVMTADKTTGSVIAK